jgi:ferredoxin--NADP+ reductase
MGELERADVEVVGADLDELSAVALGEADKTRRRNVEITQDYAARPSTGKPITVRFRFLASPVELLGDEAGHVRAVRIENNEIVARDNGTLAARGTATFDELPAQLVFRSIGYTGRAVAGIPFDERRGLIRNEGGRVTDADGTLQPGEYVAGWIKRGPSGVIGTNKHDATETVHCLLQDAPALPRRQVRDPDGIVDLLHQRGVRVVPWQGWEAIEALEIAAGRRRGAKQVKVAERELLLAAALSHPSLRS